MTEVRRYAELAKEAETLKTSEAMAKFLVAAFDSGDTVTILNAVAHCFRILGHDAYAEWMEATAKLVASVTAPRTARRKTRGKARA